MGIMADIETAPNELYRWLAGEPEYSDPVEGFQRRREWARKWLASNTCSNGYSFLEFRDLSDAFRNTIGMIPGMDAAVVPAATEEEYHRALVLGDCAPAASPWGTDEQAIKSAMDNASDDLLEQIRKGYVGRYGSEPAVAPAPPKMNWVNIGMGAIAVAGIGGLLWSVFGGKKKKKKRRRKRS